MKSLVGDLKSLSAQLHRQLTSQAQVRNCADNYLAHIERSMSLPGDKGSGQPSRNMGTKGVTL